MTDPVLLAFDVGATRQRAALADADGRLLAQNERPTPRGDPQALVAGLARQARELAGEVRPRAACLAMAGFLDVAAGRVLRAPNLQLQDAAIGPALQQALGLPVRLVNDVSAAAWGEAGAAACDDLVAIFVGSGVGTGLVCGGRLLEGARGLAGEGGHLALGAASHEDRLGGEALARRARAAGVAEDTAGLVQAWRAGVAAAGPILDGALAAMASLTRLLVVLLDPARVVLGGGVAQRCPELLAAAREAVDPHPLLPGAPGPLVEPARLGAQAGLAGAARLARAALGP